MSMWDLVHLLKLDLSTRFYPKYLSTTVLLQMSFRHLTD